MAQHKLYPFGWNGAGQLGTGDTENKKVACPVAPLEEKRVAMVACGGPYTVLATDTEEF
jgi:alpha-tubulin suppressor-like RCC1 family protein